MCHCRAYGRSVGRKKLGSRDLVMVMVMFRCGYERSGTARRG